MADFSTFAQRMRVKADNVEKNAVTLVRKVALSVDAAIVLATPVDTGRARSNWQVELDSPASSDISPYSPGEGLGVGEGANARAALAQGKAKIAQYTKANRAIHITNNLRYINKLNDGWSAQAGANFVEKAIIAGVDTIRNTKLLNKTITTSLD